MENARLSTRAYQRKALAEYRYEDLTMAATLASSEAQFDRINTKIGYYAAAALAAQESIDIYRAARAARRRA